MYYYSRHSKTERATLHPYLQRILNAVLETDDFRIEQGARTRLSQQSAFDRGASKVRGDGDYPHMVHEDGYCYAADIWPYIKGKRLAVPGIHEIIGWVATNTEPYSDKDLSKRVEDAVGRYAQFAWLMRRVQEVANEYFEELENATGEKWVLRWGGNWNMDAEILTDQGFDDYPHVEIRRIT